MPDDPKIDVLMHPTTRGLAMVILVGSRVVDVPLSRAAAQKLLRDVERALRTTGD